MAATSITGAGQGDSNKRVAYLHVGSASLQITQATTGNRQDLIGSGITGGGEGEGNRRNIRVSSGVLNDFSVNDARVYVNYQQALVFEANRGTYLAGNYNGGGTGSKPIIGIPGWEGEQLASFPKILADTTLWTPIVTVTAVPLGLSFNIMVDLSGNNLGPFAVITITNTLTNEKPPPGSTLVGDNKGFTGAAASVYDFDINDYIPGDFTPSTRNRSRFYVIGNLPGAIGAAIWPNNPLTLDILLGGGPYPQGGTQTIPYPNARIASRAALAKVATLTDGGLPKGTMMTGITAQIGDSANVRRSVAITSQLVFIEPNGTAINLLDV